MWKINKRLFLWDTPCKCLCWLGRAQPPFGSQSLDLRLWCWQLSGTHMLFAAPPSWAMTRRPLPLCSPLLSLCCNKNLSCRQGYNDFVVQKCTKKIWHSSQSKNKERMRKRGFGSSRFWYHRVVCIRGYSLLAACSWLLAETPHLHARRCFPSSRVSPLWSDTLEHAFSCFF